jgi:hypothetical protein
VLKDNDFYLVVMQHASFKKLNYYNFRMLVYVFRISIKWLDFENNIEQATEIVGRVSSLDDSDGCNCNVKLTYT